MKRGVPSTVSLPVPPSGTISVLILGHGPGDFQPRRAFDIRAVDALTEEARAEVAATLTQQLHQVAETMARMPRQDGTA